MQIDDRRYIIYFIALIIIVTCVRLAVIGLSLLTPQEAYYWNYAQHPDWSYFDHPAAASMVINFGTSLFGENSFGVRFGGVMISTILAILTFIFVRKLFNARVGFYSTLLLNVIWIFAIGAVVTTPDSPLFLFWILSVILIYYASRKNKLWLYVLWGISAGLGFASKYTMALLFPSALLFLLLTDLRSQLKTWINFAVGCMASIIAAFPVFYWNYLHDWASFAFQTSRRAGEMSSFRIDMFFGFLGSQLGIITPFIFPFMIYAIYLAARRGFSESDDRYKLLFSFAAPIIIIFTLASFRGWVKMNWPTPGYFTALIAMCAIFDENISPKLKWMKRFWRKYAIFAVSFAVIITSLSYIHSFFPILPMGKSDTMIGWYDLGKVAGFYSDKFLNDNPDNVIGYEYKIAAESAFYIDGHPDTKSDNYVGEHGLAFRFWSNPEKLIGQNFLFLYDTRFWYRPEDNLLKYFDYYYPENPLKIYGIGGKLFYFHIIRCYGYKGTES